MRFLLAVAVTSVLALALAGTASAQTLSLGKATGHGSVAASDNPFAPYDFGFTAQGVSTDGAPKGNVRFSNSDFSFHGTVDCYLQTGNEAFFSGTIGKSKGLEEPPAGQVASYAAHVTDNGEGSGSSPDTIGFLAAVGPFSLDCLSAAFIADPVDQGSIQVHPIGS